MPQLLLNADVFLLALPLLAGIFASAFGLDSLLSRPRHNGQEGGRRFSHRDGRGVAICVEPDGRVSMDGVHKLAKISRQNGLERAKRSDNLRRHSAFRPRVTAEWVNE